MFGGYEPLLDACAVCGCPTPEEPRFHLREGAPLRGLPGLCGEGISLPLSSGSLATMRHIVYGDPSVSSLSIWTARAGDAGRGGGGLSAHPAGAGFRTLDFYKSLTLTTPDRL